MDGPAAQVPVLAGYAVAVGKEKAGPMPQMIFGMSRGEESLCLNITHSAITDAVADGDTVDRHDRPGDEGPVGSDMDWDNGLEVQVEKCFVLISSAAIEVELKGYRDDVTNGVLRLFGE